MAIELKIPEVGESITEVQIAEWLKAEGDTVKQDENVAVIDSEKTTFELPSPESGKLTKIIHQAGDTVNVGTAIAHIERDGNTTAPAEKESQKQPPPNNEKRLPPQRPASRSAAPNPAARQKQRRRNNRPTRKPNAKQRSRPNRITFPLESPDGTTEAKQKNLMLKPHDQSKVNPSSQSFSLPSPGRGQPNPLVRPQAAKRKWFP